MADFDYSDAPDTVRRFLNYKLVIQARSNLTVFNYYHDLRTFSRFMLIRKDKSKYSGVEFENIPFSDATDELLKGVKSEDVYEFLSFCALTLKNNSTSRSRKLSCLRSFYNYLTKTIMIIDTNPTEKIETPKKSKTLPKFLSLEESKQLLESVDGKNSERDFAIITLFLNCGMRVSELAGINLSDINEDMTALNVTGKGSKQRRIFLNDACRNAINAYLKVRPQNVKPEHKDALFVSRNRNRISVKTVQWLIYKHLKEAGLGSLNMSVHKLRHTAATLMYLYGNTDVRVLKDILGHEELSTTQIYTHVSDEKLIEAAYNNPLAGGVKRKKKQTSSEEQSEENNEE
ncbi:MAG: tyrosine recombinase XerC [Clostridiales bacterium]|nr:tyrosine recombinase XerC [Clostridiales bacterium]